MTEQIEQIEQTTSARTRLYRALTEVPHRIYHPLVTSLRGAMDSDPDFTARACVHLATNSKIRDQQDGATIALLQAPSHFPEYREAGRCLVLGSDVYTIQPVRLQGLPPYRIFRVLDYLASPIVVTHGDEEVARFPRQKDAERSLPRIAGRLSPRKGPRVEVDALHVVVSNDHPRVRRQAEGIVRDYYTFLEDDHRRADGVLIRNRQAMKRHMMRHHLSEVDFPYLHACLFGDPPEGSKLAVLRQIAKSTDLREQLTLAEEHKIPYPILVSVLPKTTPAVAVELIQRMSPTEAANSRAWVERSGLLEHRQVREVYEAKIALATSSAARLDFRASAQGQDAGVQAAVDKAREKAAAGRKEIEGEILICLDHSGSMDMAIEVGTQIAGRIGPACRDRAFLALHNEYGRVVEITGKSYQECQHLVRGIRAGGGTRHEAALAAAFKAGCTPNKIVLVTDGGENQGDFTRLLRAYSNQEGYEPQLAMIRTVAPRCDPNRLGERLQRGGFRLDVYETRGERDRADYNVLDQVVELLGGPPAMGLVDRIMEVVLPHRVREAA